MTRRILKKIMAVTMAATMVMGALTGCGSGSYTLSKLFSSQDRVWLYIDGNVIDKNQQVKGVYVTYSDGTMLYTYGGEEAGLKTVGEYAQMDDKDIIALIEANPVDTRHELNFVDEETKTEIQEYVKSNKLKYTFNVLTDSTGNTAQSEQFVYQAYPCVASCVDRNGEKIMYNNRGRKTVIDNSYLGLINKSSIHSCGEDIDLSLKDVENAYSKAVYQIDYAMYVDMFSVNSVEKMVSSDIYDSHYVGMSVTDSENNAGVFVTKSNDFSISYDNINTNGIFVDSNAANIYGNDVFLAKEVNLFAPCWQYYIDNLESKLLYCSWDCDKLMDLGLMDTIFDYGKLGKQRFEELINEAHSLNYIESSTYNRLIEEGYISGN